MSRVHTGRKLCITYTVKDSTWYSVPHLRCTFAFERNHKALVQMITLIRTIYYVHSKPLKMNSDATVRFWRKRYERAEIPVSREQRHITNKEYIIQWWFVPSFALNGDFRRYARYLRHLRNTASHCSIMLCCGPKSCDSKLVQLFCIDISCKI